MSSTLRSFTHLPPYQGSSVATATSKAIFEGLSLRGVQQLKIQAENKGTQRNYLGLAAVVVLLHGALVVAYLTRDKSSHYVPVKHEVAIEFIKPEVIPPKPIEPPPPPPPPPPPKVKHVTPPPQPAPALRTEVADKVIAPSDITVQENTTAPKTTAPVVAPEEPAQPAPKEEPITEATANAAYLNNPKPEYPAAAARQGWGGTVTLRVHVLADGSVESVSVKKSSGRKVLDDAALSAVRKWTFVPSKRGSTPVDGWATVPIIFNSEQ